MWANWLLRLVFALEGAAPVSHPDAILLEDGSPLLLEDGEPILLEPA